MDESDDRIDLGWVLKSRDPNFKLAFPAGMKESKIFPFKASRVMEYYLLQTEESVLTFSDLSGRLSKSLKVILRKEYNRNW